MWLREAPSRQAGAVRTYGEGHRGKRKRERGECRLRWRSRQVRRAKQNFQGRKRLVAKISALAIARSGKEKRPAKASASVNHPKMTKESPKRTMRASNFSGTGRNFI